VGDFFRQAGFGFGQFDSKPGLPGGLRGFEFPGHPFDMGRVGFKEQIPADACPNVRTK
jgi:hypothetical protein